MDIKSLHPENKLFHRELSWLSFNERVLEEAVDADNPLLEQLKFIAIFANNLDEFLMVRVAGIKKLLDSGFNNLDNYGVYPEDLLARIKAKALPLIKRLSIFYNNKIHKDARKKNIVLKKYDELDIEQKKFAKKLFETTLFPMITPMAIDPGRPFPVLPSKTIAFAVTLMRYSAVQFAVIPVPKVISRVVKLPSGTEEEHFVLIDEIIRRNIDVFFKGFKIKEVSLFRVIRDSELLVEEYAPNLLRAIESEVKKRSRAKVISLEMEKTASHEILELLCERISFPKEEVTFVDNDLDLTFLFDLVGQISRPELRYQAFLSKKITYDNIFDKIQEGDLLLHLPFDSFQPTVDLVQAAAGDENVLAIKMTLYRTNEDSAIIKALKEAAKKKKQVTVLVEIKARFEEERNINWVKELEEAGCHVMYGIAEMKIHSKILLVVRKEEGKIRRYVHLSTGNYNEQTSRVYTDLGYFTCNDDFARDISDVFNVITGYSLPSRWKRIIASPNDLRGYFFELIDQEIEFQKKYKNGMITAKMNALEDIQMIEKLYQASQAGVKIRLMVRGICCLIPQVPRLSENIEVRSLVGRFLEHSRMFIFGNNSSQRVFLSSADWMSRNLDRRIELLFEIYKDETKEYLKSVMDKYWQDNVKSWTLEKDGNYVKLKSGQSKFNVQEYFISSAQS